MLTKTFRLTIALLIMGLFVGLASQGEKTWATTDGEALRQTVPTRTFTPTVTVPSPTDTPPAPPTVTHTPRPPTQATGTPTLNPSATDATASVTPSMTQTTTVTPTEGTVAAPTSLPTAGGSPWLLVGAGFLLINGIALLLAGVQTRRLGR